MTGQFIELFGTDKMKQELYPKLIEYQYLFPSVKIF